MSKYTKKLKKYFGFSKFRDKQKDIIDSIINDNRDVCAIMFTGAGKSLCYQFPAVYKKKVVIVISPLISLMNDQNIKLGQSNIKSTCLNGTVTDKKKIKKKIINNKFRLVYSTPEFIIKEQQFLKELNDSGNLLMIAIDESHCVSTWGHDFRSSYRGLSNIRKWLPDIPLMALTATATDVVKTDIINTLCLNDPLLIKTTFDRPNLNIKIIPKSTQLNDLYNLVKDNKVSIIYCQKRKDTEKICDILKDKGIKCDIYHAGMKSIERELVHENFVFDHITCVIATVAFGMGIDKTVRRVIHWGCPKDIESYYQEIGRAGRDGKYSDCILYYSDKDFSIINWFINKTENPIYRKHRMDLLSVMKKYIYTTDCRRNIILEYFGEKYSQDNCKMCDNCLNKKNVIKKDLTKEAVILLQTIYLTGNMYGTGNIINIIRGSNNKKVKKFNHLSVYNSGNKYSDKWWKIFCRMILNIDYINEKPIRRGHGSSLYRTLKGREFVESVCDNINSLTLKEKYNKLVMKIPEEMRDFYKVSSLKESSYNNNNNETNMMFKILSDIRKQIALDEGLKPELIFSDVSLYEMINKKPNNKLDFLNIVGVDSLRCEKYGQEFIDTINTYSLFLSPEGNNINSPILKKKKNKFSKNTKDITYDLFMNKKMSLKQIAISRNIKVRTVEDHIVYSFSNNRDLDLNRLNFNNNIISKVKKIYNKFNKNGKVRLRSLKDNLPDDISFLHIKMAISKLNI
jgi:ATP-dependent DNA helicase RecQ